MARLIARELEPLHPLFIEDAVRAAAETGHRWCPPLFRNDDGSVTEW